MFYSVSIIEIRFYIMEVWEIEKEDETMKKQKTGMILITTAIVGLGSMLLGLSVNYVKGSVQKNLSAEKEIVSNQQNEPENVQAADNAENRNMETGQGRDLESEQAVEDYEYVATMQTVITEEGMLAQQNREQAQQNNKQELQDREQELQDLAQANRRNEEAIRQMQVEGRALAYEEGIGWQVVSTYFMKQGQIVCVKDNLVEVETAQENGKLIMEFIFDYVDKLLLTPYGIDKTAYSYDIQRQYQVEDEVQYSVFLKDEDKIVCFIGVCLNDEPELVSFARSELVDLYGGVDNDIPEEYLVENWCKTKEQKEAIYQEYLDASKEIAAQLGMPPIKDEIKDVTDKRYFSADNEWSSVCFGYELEDGTYIKIFYNRVNQMWDGFVLE